MQLKCIRRTLSCMKIERLQAFVLAGPAAKLTTQQHLGFSIFIHTAIIRGLHL